MLYGGVKLVDSPDFENVRRLDQGAISMILAMIHNGIRIDPSYFQKLSEELREEQGCLVNDIRRTVKAPALNPNSRDQVADLLFRRLKISKQWVKQTPSGKRERLDSDTLEMISDRHPVIPKLIEHNELEKILNTYCKYHLIAGDGNRIHAHFSVTSVPSGRLALSDPNLLAVPVRSDLGKRVRMGFIPKNGNVLFKLDLSQIEMRDLAHESGDEAMIQVFLDRDDIHWRTAETVYRKPRSRLDKDEHRRGCKAVGFGIIYGITGEGLRRRIIAEGGDPEFWTEQRCDALIPQWFAAYRGALVFIESCHMRARRHLMSWDIFGRIRRIPEVRSVHPKIQAEGLRYAQNHPIQSSAQGIIKLAMAEIQPMVEEYNRKGVECLPLLQIHDELLFEANAKHQQEMTERFGKVIEGCMSGQYRVPIEWDGAVGERWGAMN